MLGKPKKYIVTFSQINQDDIDLVGEKIQKYRQAEQSGINVPVGFVVTTSAFDDFLTANDLVNFIAPRINDVNLDNPNVARKSGHDIQKAIMQATVPDIIKEPLLKAYNNLSGYTKSFVQMRTSYPSAKIDELNYGQENIIRDVTGEEILLENIKALWASLFAPDALQFRSGINYEGYLTTAIFIQKLVQAEISGKVYSVEQAGNDLDKVEITAIYGNYLPEKEHEFNFDSYVGEKKSESIIEKRIVGQDYMYVRKHNSKGKDPNLKINLSDAWKKKQKLDDKHIVNLIRMGKILEDLFKHPQEIDFVLESGKLYIYNFKIIEDVEVALASQLQKISNKLTAKEESRNTSPATPVQPQKEISDYVEEVKDAARYSDTINDVIVEDDDQVVVTVESIDKLTLIAEGDSIGDNLSYGLLHFIYTSRDWEGLTGDEIIVIEQLDESKISQINTLKGIICSSEVPINIINQIKVPLIYNARDVFEKLHENEVITVDSVTNGIYLGAGKQNKKVTDKIDKPIEEIQESRVVPTVPESISGTVKDEIDDGSKVSETNTSAAVSSPISLSEVEIATPEKVQEIKKSTTIPPSVNSNKKAEFKFDVIKVVGVKKEPIKSSSSFIQIIDLDKPAVDISCADGMFIDLTELYIKYDISISKLSKSKIKRHFIEEFIIMINDSVDVSKNKPIVISSGNMSKLKDHFKDDENMLKLNLLMIELELVSVLRNRERLRNIWYSLSDVNSEKDQIDQKKIISSQGLRRSSTFKLNVNIDSMLGALMVKPLVKSGIDGVILNLDSLIERIYGGEDSDKIDEEVSGFLSWLIHVVNTNSTKSYIRYTSKLGDNAIEKLTSKGLVSFIVPLEMIPKLKKKIASKEVESLTKAKRRGRKKKVIDYGF